MSVSASISQDFVHFTQLFPRFFALPGSEGREGVAELLFQLQLQLLERAEFAARQKVARHDVVRSMEHLDFDMEVSSSSWRYPQELDGLVVREHPIFLEMDDGTMG